MTRYPTARVPVVLSLFRNRLFWLSGIEDVDARLTPEAFRFHFRNPAECYDFLRCLPMRLYFAGPEYTKEGVLRMWLFMQSATDEVSMCRVGAVYVLDPRMFVGRVTPPKMPLLAHRDEEVDWCA